MATQFYADIKTAIAHSRHTAVTPLVWDPITHVTSRFGFGPTPALRGSIAKNGMTWWLNRQTYLGVTKPGYSAHPGVAAVGPQLGLSPYEARRWALRQPNHWTIMDQLSKVTLGLQTWSPAQLYESLVDFFSNHLNVSNHNAEVLGSRHAYDRDVIRPFVMRNFTSMLLASAKHPAMLTFLSLKDSTKAAINENYGRELLELHTVGLRYSESDVRNAAALLTGRTLGEFDNYVFNPAIHPTGKIKVLGFTDANSSAGDGGTAGDALLRYLARHPYTATNLARKMCVRFVSDTPSTGLVNAVANAYLSHGTKIMPMVHTILTSTEFWESRGRKLRRPAENAVATFRALQPRVTDYALALDKLSWTTTSMNNGPLDWQAPDGYPDNASAWRSSGNMVWQWRTQLSVSAGTWAGIVAPSVDKMYQSAPATSGQALAALTKHLTGMTFGDADLAVLQRFVGEPATTPMSKSRLSWAGYLVAALILHSPHFALR